MAVGGTAWWNATASKRSCVQPTATLPGSRDTLSIRQRRPPLGILPVGPLKPRDRLAIELLGRAQRQLHGHRSIPNTLSGLKPAACFSVLQPQTKIDTILGARLHHRKGSALRDERDVGLACLDHDNRTNLR